ncbi:hypothetical protein, partial [Streptococcus pneumoniae]|uniref:hypothetical protein n=1 Tax=Streptococcus pneumoniae TaxID=1313 RepID=UPI0018B0C1D9
SIGAALYPRSDDEINASAVPTEYSKPYGWLTRFGTDKAAMDTALSASDSVYVPPGVYTFAGTVTVAEGKTIYGDGLASQIN